MQNEQSKLITYNHVGAWLVVGTLFIAIGVAVLFGWAYGFLCYGAFFLALAATGSAYLRENKNK